MVTRLVSACSEGYVIFCALESQVNRHTNHFYILLVLVIPSIPLLCHSYWFWWCYDFQDFCLCSQNLKHLAMSAVSATVLSHLFLRYALLLAWASPSSLSWLVSKPQGFSSPTLELYKPVPPHLPLKGSKGYRWRVVEHALYNPAPRHRGTARTTQWVPQWVTTYRVGKETQWNLISESK